MSDSPTDRNKRSKRDEDAAEGNRQKPATRNACASTTSSGEECNYAADHELPQSAGESCVKNSISEPPVIKGQYEKDPDAKAPALQTIRRFAKSAARAVWKALKLVLVAGFTFLTVSWISVGQEWDQLIKSPDFFWQEFSANRWEDTIEKYIRLHESKDYVESIMGIPQINEVKQLSEKEIEYETSTYINPNFSLFCVYVDETLKGFLVISNSESFRPTNYRVDISLLNDTITSASKKCDSNYMFNECLAANYGLTGRLSSNAYYIECKTQHSAGGCENTLVGYGITDIGLWDFSQSVANLLNKDEEAFSYLWKKGIMMSQYSFKLPAEIKDCTFEMRTITNNPDLTVRQQRINAFFIFDEDKDLGFALLRDSLMTTNRLGINKDRYASFNSDYPINYKNYQKRS